MADNVRILMSCCMKETHTHRSGYKQLFRRLKSLYLPEKLDSREELNPNNLADVALIVFGCPSAKFTHAELEMLRSYVFRGGSLLVLMSAGGESSADTNINYLLEEFGIAVNPDFVVRMAHYKYMHPKEVLISDGVANRGLLDATGMVKNKRGNGMVDGLAGDHSGRTQDAPGCEFDGSGLEFVYPFGATLSIQKPAIPLLSTGGIAYPIRRPIGITAHLCCFCSGSKILAIVTDFPSS